MNIFIGNLSGEVTEADVRAAFGPFGKIDSAVIIKDKYSGQSKGFAFVEMPSKAEAQAAIEELNGTPLKGKTLTVNEARPKTDNRSGGRSSFGGGQNRNRGGFGGEHTGNRSGFNSGKGNNSYGNGRDGSSRSGKSSESRGR